MNKILITFLISSCFLACSQKNKYSFGEWNPSNIKEQVFKIALHKDTLLKTQAGVLLQLNANTFNTTLTEVEMVVKEILNKEDLLKSGMPTVDENGQILESGGMIQVQTNPKIAINPKFPIQISVPTQEINPNMKKYTADIENGALLWKYAEPLVQHSASKDSLQGKQLFITHCSNCHDKNLEANLTGPPLGCIEQGNNRRNRTWLLNFTKNSQKMVAEGDPLAVCNWNQYKPTVMSNFEFLTDLQIHQIYDYINQESLKRNLCQKERTHLDTTNCNPQPQTEPDLIIDTKTKIIYQKTLNNKVLTRTEYYTFTVSDYQWVNCDYTPFDQQEVDAFKVIAEAGLEMFLIFKNRKSLWPLATWKNAYILIETEDEAKIKLPVGEPVTLLAFSKLKNGKRNFVELQTEVKMKNDIHLVLQSVSEDAFQKALKKYN